MKLDVKAFALALGIVFAVGSFLTYCFVLFTGQGTQFLEIIAPLHPGSSVTFLGALIGSFWMLIYGLIIGAVIAYIYNYFAKE